MTTEHRSPIQHLLLKIWPHTFLQLTKATKSVTAPQISNVKRQLRIKTED